MLVGKLMAFADGDLKVTWLKRAALACWKSALLRRARKNTALSPGMGA